MDARPFATFLPFDNDDSMATTTDTSTGTVPASQPKPAPAETAAASPPLSLPNPRAGRHALIAFAVLLLIGAGVAYYYFFLAPYESTDDAFIEGHVTAVSPQVAGPVVRLLVKDNELVKAGDLLLQIDPRDYAVKLAQVRAGVAAARDQLEQTKAQLAVDQAKADQEQASVAAAEADATRAQADLNRFQSVDSRAIARSQVDLAQDQASATAAQVEVARARARAAEAQVALSQTHVDTAESEVQVAQAYEQQAALNLSYTDVVAPTSGIITRRSVELGGYVQTGQPMLSIVQPHVWVIANFKETQLAYMRPGQPVTIAVDAFPQYALTGRVDSIQDGSGARFSLLPPENATGNYIKVVQRVPVKIVLDEPLPAGVQLSPGMSVIPSVKVQ
jgi:membrane fusion protein (multidrug efflux system)